MLTTNYYNMKYNNRLFKSPYLSGSSYPYYFQNSSLVLNGMKQIRYVNGNYSVGDSDMYGGCDVLFGSIPHSVEYNSSGKRICNAFAIGFDGSDSPATIDDFKLIEPILNCSIVSSTYNIINNTIIQEITIKNNNNTEIIIKGVGLFGVFSYDKPNSSTYNLPLLYREVFTSPITVPSGSSFIYRLETTEGE